MKLSPAQVERVEACMECQAVPDDHAASPQLETVFGSHTFFLDSEGLSIVEPSPEDGEVANVVKLANWTDERRTTLAPHPPEPTPTVVEIGGLNWDDEEETDEN
jgi:hypothetical protein